MAERERLTGIFRPDDLGLNPIRQVGSSDDGLLDLFGPDALGPGPQFTQGPTSQFTLGSDITGSDPTIIKPEDIEAAQRWYERPGQPLTDTPGAVAPTPTPAPAESQGLLQQILQNPNIQRAITTGVAGLGAGPYGALAAGQQFEVGEAQRRQQEQREREEAHRKQVLAVSQGTLTLAQEREAARLASTREDQLTETFKKRALAGARRGVRNIEDLIVPVAERRLLGDQAGVLFSEAVEVIKKEEEEKRVKIRDSARTELQTLVNAGKQPSQKLFDTSEWEYFDIPKDPNERTAFPMPDVYKKYTDETELFLTAKERFDFFVNQDKLAREAAEGKELDMNLVMRSALPMYSAAVELRTQLLQDQRLHGKGFGPNKSMLQPYTEQEHQLLLDNAINRVKSAFAPTSDRDFTDDDLFESLKGLDPTIANTHLDGLIIRGVPLDQVNRVRTRLNKEAGPSIVEKIRQIAPTRAGLQLGEEFPEGHEDDPRFQDLGERYLHDRSKAIIQAVIDYRKGLPGISKEKGRELWHQLAQGQSWKLAEELIGLGINFEEEEEKWGKARQEKAGEILYGPGIPGWTAGKPLPDELTKPLPWRIRTK